MTRSRYFKHSVIDAMHSYDWDCGRPYDLNGSDTMTLGDILDGIRNVSKLTERRFKLSNIQRRKGEICHVRVTLAKRQWMC